MAYEVLEPELTVHKSLGYVEDEKGKKFHNVVANTYFKGDVIADEDIAPYVVEAYESGDEHTRSILKKVDSQPKSIEKEVKTKKSQGRPKKSVEKE